jgi:hypothetical protein
MRDLQVPKGEKQSKRPNAHEREPPGYAAAGLPFMGFSIPLGGEYDDMMMNYVV